MRMKKWVDFMRRSDIGKEKIGRHSYRKKYNLASSCWREIAYMHIVGRYSQNVQKQRGFQRKKTVHMAYYEAPTSWELAKSRNVLTLPTAAATFEIIIIVVVDDTM